MDIVIIPPDNRMAVDGVHKTVVLDRPNINAARLSDGKGVIEHRKHGDEWLPPRKLTEAEFLENFQAELIAFSQALTDEELAAQRREEAVERSVPENYEPTLQDLLMWLEMSAEAQRSRHITPGPTMGVIYAEKAAEAVAVDAMGREEANALPDNGRDTFPLLAASVGIEAPTLFDVADLVGNRVEETNAALAGIERVRLAAKAAIKAAGSVAEAKEILEAVAWP